MQDGDRGALIALGMLLTAIVLIAAIQAFPTGDGPAQWLMAIFSIASTGVSLYAVKLVRDTFRETKTATVAATKANRIAVAANRPWISLDFKIGETGVHVPGTELQVGHYWFVLKNVGPAVALDVRMVSRHVNLAEVNSWNPDDLNAARVYGLEQVRAEAAAAPWIPIPLFLPDDEKPQNAYAGPLWPGTVVFACVAYKTAGSDDFLFTGVAFEYTLMTPSYSITHPGFAT